VAVLRDTIAPMNCLATLKIALLMSFFTALASAQLNVELYRQSVARGGNAEQVAKAYLGGAGLALGAANAVLTANHQRLLYCAPEKLPLNVGNMESIIYDWIREMSKATPVEVIEKLPVATVLLNAMIDAFPCPVKP